MIKINSGITAPKGFSAGGIHCGIRKNKNKEDLMLIFSELPCNTAAVYTQNLVCGAPITVTRENLEKSGGVAHAVICNSGNANTCNSDGIQIAKRMCAAVAPLLKITEEQVIVASTGVIGQRLDVSKIEAHSDLLVKSLGKNEKSSENAAKAIMTTDLVKKEIAVSLELDGREVKIGAIAKGSGMIHPNMATMLSFITTDAAIDTKMLQKALLYVTNETFNMVSIDGDTSTNDMVSIMANGAAGNTAITSENENYDKFVKALLYVCNALCREIAKDGEGATKLILCSVFGAGSAADAKKCAKSVICSALVKAAMFGADANWGRVLCALGYSGAKLDASKIDVGFSSKKGEVSVCRSGYGVDFSEELAKEILLCDTVEIKVKLGDGKHSATAYGCDLTYEYVKINGDYRT